MNKVEVYEVDGVEKLLFNGPKGSYIAGVYNEYNKQHSVDALYKELFINSENEGVINDLLAYVKVGLHTNIIINNQISHGIGWIWLDSLEIKGLSQDLLFVCLLQLFVRDEIARFDNIKGRFVINVEDMWYTTIIKEY